MAKELVPNTTGLAKKMSSIDIAELTGKNHQHVMRDIRKLIETMAIAESNFGRSEYKDASGKSNPMFELDFQATMTLITGYDAKRRSAVVKRWIALETGEAEPALIKPTTKDSIKALAIIEKAFRSAYKIAKIALPDRNQAVLKADIAARKLTGQSPLTILDIELKSPSQKRLLTPSDAGAAISNGTKLSGRKVNEILAAIGLQEAQRDAKNRIYWKPTAKGKPFAVLLDTNKRHNDGTAIQQVKWTEDIVPMVASAVDEVA